MKCGNPPDHTVNGFKVPSDAAVTENERQWIEILRIICNDDVPAPNLALIVSLRKFYADETVPTSRS